LEEYVKKKVSRMRQKKLLKKWIMHWACKPGGPIYKMCMRRLTY
jgi:hypothetical protein